MKDNAILCQYIQYDNGFNLGCINETVTVINTVTEQATLLNAMITTQMTNEKINE